MLAMHNNNIFNLCSLKMRSSLNTVALFNPLIFLAFLALIPRSSDVQ